MQPKGEGGGLLSVTRFTSQSEPMALDSSMSWLLFTVSSVFWASKFLLDYRFKGFREEITYDGLIKKNDLGHLCDRFVDLLITITRTYKFCMILCLGYFRDFLYVSWFARQWSKTPVRKTGQFPWLIFFFFFDMMQMVRIDVW